MVLESLRKKEADDKLCCVCGHELIGHIDELIGWRCHSTATQDSLQCECFLRKDRCSGGGIDFYNLSRRREMSKKMIVRR